MSENGQSFVPEQSNVVQVTTSQEINPVAPPSPITRQIQNIGIKSPSFPHPTPINQRLPVTTQSSNEFSSLTSSTNIELPRISDTNDPYLQPPSTPKPANQPTVPQNFQQRSDLFIHQAPTHRLKLTTPLQGFPQGVRPPEGLEITRQLRDLLQKQQQQQQFKKIDEQLLPGKGQQRIWPPNEGNHDPEQPTTTSDTTFRHPLPPAIIRQRGPVPLGGILRQPLGIRMQGPDPRIQNLDPRMRLLLQQQQVCVCSCVA